MRLNRSSATKQLISLALLFSLCLLHAGVRPARAQLLPGLTQTVTQTLSQTTQTLTQVVKVSPDLLRLVADAPATVEDSRGAAVPLAVPEAAVAVSVKVSFASSRVSFVIDVRTKTCVCPTAKLNGVEFQVPGAPVSDHSTAGP